MKAKSARRLEERRKVILFPDRRRVSQGEFYRFLGILLVAAFILNWFWEMAQMLGYDELSGRSWMETARRCTIATLGDAGITLAIYMMGALAARDLAWGLRGRWNVYITCGLLGFFVAWFIECYAIAAGRWSYTASMPRMPLLHAGVWPLLHLTLLVSVSVWLARRFSVSTEFEQKAEDK